jgi:pimeloyl-ACP methyl ester carboxylesterase
VGPRPLLVVQGLLYENKPQSSLTTRMYRFLGNDYQVYVVLRRPGMPFGYSLQDMADDYAATIRDEIGSPVDVIGISTGGSIAQLLAADFPELVRRLVIHSSAYKLSDEAKALQRQVALLAENGEWRRASSLLVGTTFPSHGFKRQMSRPLIWLASVMLSLSAPDDPSDLLITIEAEDRFDASDRLCDIAAPTLVVAGAEDAFYTETLFRDTAARIPNARLVLYPGMGHPASGGQFQRDVTGFLREGRID